MPSSLWLLLWLTLSFLLKFLSFLCHFAFWLFFQNHHSNVFLYLSALVNRRMRRLLTTRLCELFWKYPPDLLSFLLGHRFLLRLCNQYLWIKGSWWLSLSSFSNDNYAATRDDGKGTGGLWNNCGVKETNGLSQLQPGTSWEEPLTASIFSAFRARHLWNWPLLPATFHFSKVQSFFKI